MIRFEKSKLTLDGRDFELEYPIQDARELGSRVIVLFRPESSRGVGQFQNLVAYDDEGRKLWAAEIPTNLGMDAYYQLLPGPELIADSYSSFRCTLDPETGVLVAKSFHK
jgi:hypothetical protein